MSISVDNKSAIDWLLGTNISASTIHVEIRMFRLRNAVKTSEVNLKDVKTEENEADLFTKSLGVKQFNYLMAKVMGHNLITGRNIRGVRQGERANLKP